MKRRLRFSLLSLLLSVLLLGSAAALWLHWEPWVLQARISHVARDLNFAYFSPDEQSIVCGSQNSAFVLDSSSGEWLSSQRWRFANIDLQYSSRHEVKIPECYGVLGRRPVVVTMDNAARNGQPESLVDAWRSEFQSKHAHPVIFDAMGDSLENTLMDLSSATNARIVFARDIAKDLLSRSVLRRLTGDPLEMLQTLANLHDLDLEYKNDAIFVVTHRQYVNDRRDDEERNPRVFDLLTGGERLTVLTGCPSAIMALAISPDGTRVGAGCVDGSVHIWDENGRYLSAISTRHAWIRSLALSNGGKRVAVSFTEMGAGAWDCETGKPLIAFLDKMSSIVDISPDGSRALFFRWAQPTTYREPDETYHLWDLDHDKELRVLPMNSTRPLQNTQFSPDGKRFVSMQISDHHLIDAVSGQDVAEFNPNALAISFSTDSQKIAATDAFGTALYDAGNGARLAAFPEKVRSIADLWNTSEKSPRVPTSPRLFYDPPPPQFSSEGRRLLATMSDGELGVWKRVRPERWWGLAWLPEFWTTLVLALLLAGNTIRNWRRA